MDLTAPIIHYHPFGDEVNGLSYFSSAGLTTGTILSADKDANPLEWAARCGAKYHGVIPNILIPGKKFDLRGTRRGRGAGWYDRFLSAIPRAWPRIGVADISQLSPSFLECRAWDEPVDWLLVKKDSSWMVYETRARFP